PPDTSAISTLSLHDALPILERHATTRAILVRGELDDLLALRSDVVFIPIEEHEIHLMRRRRRRGRRRRRRGSRRGTELHRQAGEDRKSTRLNSSHLGISYAV